jgi:hypothetical protein
MQKLYSIGLDGKIIMYSELERRGQVMVVTSPHVSSISIWNCLKNTWQMEREQTFMNYYIYKYW